MLAAPALLRVLPAAAALDRDIGAMLVFGFSGTRAAGASARALAIHIAAGRAGGALFLGDNIGSRADVLDLAALFASSGRAPLLATDQEGGNVQRLSIAEGFARLPRAVTVPARMDVAAAEGMYRSAGAELAAAGFNLNLAPVADLHNPQNPVIGAFGRAFSADPDVTAAYVTAAIAGFAAGGILTTVKHFPGHGFSRGDSHDGPVDITATWRAEELVPFRRIIEAGSAEAVMTGHLIHRTLTGGRPASLSPIAIEGVLRGDLGFAGVVVTDDLDMRAIRATMSLEAAIVAAIAAGNDLLLISNSAEPDPDLPAIAVEWVARAIADGRVPGARIATANARIRRLKARAGGPGGG